MSRSVKADAISFDNFQIAISIWPSSTVLQTFFFEEEESQTVCLKVLGSHKLIFSGTAVVRFKQANGLLCFSPGSYLVTIHTAWLMSHRSSTTFLLPSLYCSPYLTHC